MSGSGKSSQGDYSRLDRALHHLAFRFPRLQRTLVDLENDLYGKELRPIHLGSEVFVTGLPRSGTTLLLNLLYETGEFTTFTYRQMPFLQIPLLWRRMSAPFQQVAVEKERAHGDKVSVSYDSPEAFEESIWLAHMRDRIETDHYLRVLGSGDCTPGCRDALRQTVKKLKLLAKAGQPDTSTPPRYLSKNNANVSRLGAVRTLFPDAVIFVPFREPAAHVGSLIQQHERFLARHDEDEFARHYMRWLGHFEFGGNFKPINFDAWLDGRDFDARTVDQDFWLEYWVAAYSHVLAQTEADVILVDFDALLADGARLLGRIAGQAGLRVPEGFSARADSIRAPTTRAISRSEFHSDTWERAQALHRRLVAAAN